MAGHEYHRRLVWAAGLLVATGAGVATAHGLFQVAAAAGAPAAIAWLYPLITDGLALVAYAATSRISSSGRRYAAGIVVLAAGLSGLAQATYLTGGLTHAGGRTGVPTLLRFGVGAWPAIAAALTAHLLHLIGDRPHPAASPATVATVSAPPGAAVQPSTPPGVQPHPGGSNPVRLLRSTTGGVQPGRSRQSDGRDGRTGRRGSSPSSAPARERATAAALDHQARHGALPSVSELMILAEVARGTAGAVLKQLREPGPALHVVPAGPTPRTTP